MGLQELTPLLVVAASLATSTGVAAGPAEFAFRWEVRNGGPANADEVAMALRLQVDKSKTYQVLYFDVTQPGPVPTGYQALGRERRSTSNAPDATYKIRGPEPIPSELLSWTCPLVGHSESKAEVDIGFQGLSQIKRSFSVSCTMDKTMLKAGLPLGYSANEKGCSSTMERTRAKSEALEVKVERWSLPKGRVVVEVSMAGSDSKDDLARFRDNVVRPLLDQKAVPIEENKTALGSDC